MGLDEGRDIEVAGIVAMSDEQWLLPEPWAIGQERATRTEKNRLVDEVDGAAPRR